MHTAGSSAENVQADVQDFAATRASMKVIYCVVHLGALPVEHPLEQILPINIAGTYNVTGESSFSGATVNFISAIVSTGPRALSGRPVFFNSNNPPFSSITPSVVTLGATTAQVTCTVSTTWSRRSVVRTGALDANPAARLAWNGFSPSARKQMLW